MSQTEVNTLGMYSWPLNSRPTLGEWAGEN